MSDNEEGGNVREQDRFLPIANISRIMKKALPGNAKIAKDAKETVQECVSEFISFITSECVMSQARPKFCLETAWASDKCQREKRKTINGDDLLWSMTTLGFEDYVEPLKLYLQKFRQAEVRETLPLLPLIAGYHQRRQEGGGLDARTALHCMFAWREQAVLHLPCWGRPSLWAWRAGCRSATPCKLPMFTAELTQMLCTASAAGLQHCLGTPGTPCANVSILFFLQLPWCTTTLSSRAQLSLCMDISTTFSFPLDASQGLLTPGRGWMRHATISWEFQWLGLEHPAS
ncbi:hypothetical protein QJQ45_014314 [Haematococcus lacustris]|nr:hypothetical protein QJQ45_014314 [Haematococcus lacustris]